MESEKEKEINHKHVALVNFLIKHPKYLPSGFLINLDGRETLIRTTEKNRIKCKIDILFFEEVIRARDKAISGIFAYHDISIEQIEGLTLNDIDIEKKVINLRNGDGSVAFCLYINDDVVDAILAYLRVRPPTIENKLFLSVPEEKGESYDGRHNFKS